MRSEDHYPSDLKDRRWVSGMKKGLRPIVLIGLIAAVAAIIICLGAVAVFVVGDFLGTRGPSEQEALKSVPWIPDSAEVVFVKDSHRGAHGEGRTFICFRCGATDFDRLAKMFPWEPQPLPEETVSLVQSSVSMFDIPQDQAPLISEPQMMFYRETKQAVSLCDPERRMVWHLSVTW